MRPIAQNVHHLCLYHIVVHLSTHARPRISRYPMRRHTAHLNVQYFVKEKFESDYQGSLARLENSVEEEYIAVMKQNCYRERNYRE